MTRYTPAEAQPKKKSCPLLPIIGLLLAVCLAVIAYVVAPPLVDLVEDQNIRIAQQFEQFRRDYGENSLDYIAAALLWLVMLALTAFIVALLIGKDPNREVFEYMGPHPSDKKAVAKARGKAQKEARKRIKRREAQRKKEQNPF